MGTTLAEPSRRIGGFRRATRADHAGGLPPYLNDPPKHRIEEAENHRLYGPVGTRTCMEIRDTGKYAHRRDTIKSAQDALGASSMTKAVLAACDYAARDAQRKRDALEYLQRHVGSQHVEEVAETLHSSHVPVSTTATVTVGKGDE